MSDPQKNDLIIAGIAVLFNAAYIAHYGEAKPERAIKDARDMFAHADDQGMLVALAEVEEPKE